MAQVTSVTKSLGTIYYTHDHGKIVTANAVGVKYKNGVKKSDQFVVYNEIKYDNAHEWIKKVFSSSGKKCMVKIDSTPRPTTELPKKPVLSFGSI